MKNKTILTAIFATVLILVLTAVVRAENCDVCHHNALALGEKSLCVPPQIFATTPHAGLLCSDCHKGNSIYPHETSASVRCDLPCHVAGASHAKISELTAAGPHANLGGNGKPACLGCHDSAESKKIKSAEAEKFCLDCHAGMKAPPGFYPTDKGAFGRAGHEALGDKKPTCAACHSPHATKKGEGTSGCAKPGCHEGSNAEFATLYTHGNSGDAPPSLAKIGLWLALGLCAVLAIQAIKG